MSRRLPSLEENTLRTAGSRLTPAPPAPGLRFPPPPAPVVAAAAPARACGSSKSFNVTGGEGYQTFATLSHRNVVFVFSNVPVFLETARNRASGTVLGRTVRKV